MTDIANHDNNEEDIVMITSSDGEEYEVPTILLAMCKSASVSSLPLLDSEQWGIVLDWFDRWQHVVTSTAPITPSSSNAAPGIIPHYSPHMARIVVADHKTLDASVPPLLPWYDCGVDVNRIDRLYTIATLWQCTPLLEHCQRVHATINDINTRRWSMDDIKRATLVPAADNTTATPSKGRLLFVIDGRVYDATHFIDKHPGGKVLLQGIANDATVQSNHITHCII